MAPPTIGEWLLAQVGSNNLPLFAPLPSAEARTDGATGFAAAGVPLVLDGTIPTVGTSPVTAQLIVANRLAVYVYAGEPVLEAFPEPGAPTLEVLYRIKQYVAIEARYPLGVAVVSGSAYLSNPTWA